MDFHFHHVTQPPPGTLPMKYLPFILLLSFATPSVAQHDYKVSRMKLRDGEYDEAIKILDKWIAKAPQDSEWVYQLAIAQTGQGNLETANATVKRALAMGVAPGRFAADAQHLFKPLVETEEFKTLLASVRNVPIQGPMMGNATATSASIWLRTAGPSKVQILYGDKQAASPATSRTVETTAEKDFTAVVKLDGLTPKTMYTYQIVIDGQTDKTHLPASFVTAPVKGEPTKFRFAFGGGAGYVPEHEYMWDTIGAQKPDALVLLGDNMYSDDPKNREMQKFCYYRRQSPPEFRRLTGGIPVYSIWDDHDFGTNDCSGGPAIDSPDWKLPVWNVFRQNWVNPGYGAGEKRPGCWYDFYRG
ncbi:MAG: alkaline phosphatase D, partial [Pirellulaceae bacterium]